MNEESLFHRALELSASERAAFLDRECSGNVGLRERLEILLQAHENPGSFLRAPVPHLQVTAEQSPITERPGTIIGAYKLKEQIGEGGFGLVFVAEQQEPVRRRVALKIIKPGMDTREVIARFEAERQALALMDHPNIARVFDGGATDSGRPYFVMELVKGIPIIEYCDQQQLTAKERLQLFIVVCQAVQHAHGKGIIHRDLKPSNILVAPHDGVPVVKVIDFGVAKAVGQQLTEKSVYTRFTQMIGTPLYMSPEQAEINALDVDIRSDVYSLGVLLYELLTGTTPFERERFATAAFDEIRRIIREEEPPKPSTRLTTLGASLSKISEQRKTAPAKLSALVTGDLDWIVMKSLEKDRTRRYETASGLAKDVERFLKDETVEACPPSAWYRFRKMARRNKAAMTTAALVAATLLVGVVVSAWQAVRATRAEDAALVAGAQQAQLRLAAEEQRKLAVAAEADARISEEKAKESEMKATASAALASTQERLAKEQAKIAEEEREKAQANEAKAEWRLYASQIALAQKAWESTNVALLYHHLNECRPDFRGWEHDYLYTLANAGHRDLHGHASNLFDLTYSPDGKLLVSAGGQSKGAAELNIWDVVSGKILMSLEGHTSWIRKVAISTDGKRLASASGDKTAKVWDLASGKNVMTLTGHFGTVWNVAYSPDGKLLASVSGKSSSPEIKGLQESQIGYGDLFLWDAVSGERKASLKGHTSAVYGVTFSPDGKHLVSGANDGTVKVWDVISGAEIRSLKGPANMVYGIVAFGLQGKVLICRGVSEIKAWDTETWQELWSFGIAASGRLAISPDGKSFAQGAENAAVKLYDVVSGKELRSFQSHTSQPVGVAFSPDGKFLASAARGIIKIWDLAINSQDKLVQDPDYIKKGKGGFLAPDDQPVFNREKNRVAKRNKNGALEVHDVASGKVITTLAAGIEVDEFVRFGFSPDSRRLVTVSSKDSVLGFPANEEVKAWDLDTGKALLTLERDFLTHIRMSSDGKYMVAVSFSLPGDDLLYDLTLCDLESAKQTQIAKNSYQRIIAVVFSPDGKRLAFARGDGKENDPVEVEVWDLAANSRSLVLRGHAYGVAALAFSLDGQRLASASGDKTIKIWNLVAGQVELTLRGHTESIFGVAFSPDGKRLASCSPLDKTVRLWDTKSGQEVLSLPGVVRDLSFSPDGKRLFATRGGRRVFDDPQSILATWDASKSMKEQEQK